MVSGAHGRGSPSRPASPVGELTSSVAMQPPGASSVEHGIESATGGSQSQVRAAAPSELVTSKAVASKTGVLEPTIDAIDGIDATDATVDYTWTAIGVKAPGGEILAPKEGRTSERPMVKTVKKRSATKRNRSWPRKHDRSHNHDRS
jgi:hypothetical protein